MEGFLVYLKTFLGLAMPNQSCLDVTKLISSWLLGDIFELEISNLNGPCIYIVLLYYMIGIIVLK